jgi:hypothetical protein
MKKQLFMLKKILIDLSYLFSSKENYILSDKLNSDTLEYPFIFDESLIRSGKRQALIKNFDSNGIPLNSAYIDVEKPRLHYYPISIGQVGISVYQTYLNTKNKIDLDRFLKFADWFESNKTEDELGIYWLTDIEKPEYKINSKWKSAFSQSRAISIFVRAYHETRKIVYLNYIDKALDMYFIEQDNLGVSVKTARGLIFEEYVAEKPTMVLDGHLFALFGLYDLYKYRNNLPETINKKTKALINLGLNGLEDTFEEYDLGYWLKFNLCKMPHYPKVDPCTVAYMKLIRLQLKISDALFPSNELKNMLKKIDRYLTIKNAFKAYLTKFESLKKLNRL